MASRATALTHRGQHRHSCSYRRKQQRFCRCAASSITQEATRQVAVEVEKAARNSRRLYAGIDIAAPVELVWGALTDYDGLGTFIPGLAENRCLERRPAGAKLLQVGEQDLAFGTKFRARVVLDIREHERGIPAALLHGSRSNGHSERGSGGESSNGREESSFPEPRSPLNGAPARDISFAMVDGDFQAFQGVWRMQQGKAGSNSTRLSYALFVRPQIWMPIRLIQGRIEGEIANNLGAVRKHSERLFAGLGDN
ncbi:hypothetical protein WJX72_001629 [[Myrmecia] bisecta]|uniref:Coenzyme Q-binding protein COQ10 START domain-containing protein n=1 Tax=[Myrmecia] bisecta TaxID=41462 RepID=A0AAW1P5F7_9CHLO